MLADKHFQVQTWLRQLEEQTLANELMFCNSSPPTSPIDCQMLPLQTAKASIDARNTGCKRQRPVNGGNDNNRKKSKPVAPMRTQTTWPTPSKNIDNRWSQKCVDPQSQLAAARLEVAMQELEQAQARNHYVDLFNLPQPLTFCSKMDAALYESLERSLDEQYKQLDDVWREAGLANVSCDSSASTFREDARIVADGNEGFAVRFVAVRPMPFDAETIDRIAWQCAAKESIKTSYSPENEAKPDKIYIKREFLLQQPNTPGVKILLRAIFKRYMTKDRIIVIWNGTGDWPEEYSKKCPRSAPIRERGYGIVRPLSGIDSNKCSSPVSLSQYCVFMTPGCSAAVEMKNEEMLQLMADVIVPSYREILAARRQILENAILDEMMDKKR